MFYLFAVSFVFASPFLQFGPIQIPLGKEIQVKQRVKEGGRKFIRLSFASTEVTLFSDPVKTDLYSQIYFSSRILEEGTNKEGKKIAIAHVSPITGQTSYSLLFDLNGAGNIWGYATSPNATDLKKIEENFLPSLRRPVGRSLTDENYMGVKYYLGWGDAGGSPESMQNEVKYDVAHTQKIFTSQVGGNYKGKEMTGTVSPSQVQREWKELKEKMTWDDMYVQYSSGHGSPQGLGIGLTYDEIAENILELPAKEIIVFTMACFSGGLVNAFNERKDQWKNFGNLSRTLFVMSSSPDNQESKTGPGTDPDEPGGPDGSAGSAFGHALWKALIGYADGYEGGVKDGLLSLGEIRSYTEQKTSEIGGHQPKMTGVYDDNLVMNRVPPKEFIDSLPNSENLTDRQIRDRIEELDRVMRLINR